MGVISRSGAMNIHLQDIYIAERLHLSKLDIAAGTLTHIIGQNGAGKSTLLHVIAGLISSESLHAEMTISDIPPAHIAAHRCCLTQHNDSVFGLTVAELFRFYTPFSFAPESIDNVLQVNQYQARLLRELSGGQQQRVHIARCMMQIWEAIEQGRGVLLFDEPFDALDLAYQIKWLACLHDLQQLGNIIVIAHHQLAWLNECPDDDVLIMQDGQVQAHGKIAATWQPECLTQYFHILEQHIPLYLQSSS